MNANKLVVALTTGLAFVAVLTVGLPSGTSRARADDGDGDAEQSRIRRGFEIAPVPLNLEGKNRGLVGLGSYLVNASGDCDGCHSAGPATQYARGGNPYFKGNPPKVINQVTYLGGGRHFPPLVAGATPEIISRNLTPDKTGRPEGGRTFEEFRHIMRTGADLDHLHPNCSDPSILASSSCFPAALPFDGELLQIMPWPVYQNMTDHELRAIYEYLSAVPCIEGPPAPSPLHNDCS